MNTERGLAQNHSVLTAVGLRIGPSMYSVAKNAYIDISPSCCASKHTSHARFNLSITVLIKIILFFSHNTSASAVFQPHHRSVKLRISEKSDFVRIRCRTAIVENRDGVCCRVRVLRRAACRRHAGDDRHCGPAQAAPHLRSLALAIVANLS